MQEEFNITKSIIGQRKYCDNSKAPHFAPSNGVCWKCRKNIYEKHEKTIILSGEEITHKRGISVEKASNGLVTGCPHCNMSYCD